MPVVDPVPDAMRTGVLLADQIAFFVDAVHLIEPSTFLPDDLRPSAYDLHIGDTYYVDDEPKTLGAGEWFKIPANGLVYVKTREILNIPYYMVARYSLRVTHVYRGLLIDNGLHVHPGYHGPIYIPVHNFTDQDRTLSEGQSFLSMEFARTTPLPPGASIGTPTEADLVGEYGKDGIDGHGGYKTILFHKRREDLLKPHRTPKDFWNRFPGEIHKSAMIGTEERLQKLKGSVDEELQKYEKKVRNISAWAAFGFLVALLGILVPWLTAVYFDSRQAHLESARVLETLSQEVQDLKSQVAGRPVGSAAQAPVASPQRGKQR